MVWSFAGHSCGSEFSQLNVYEGQKFLRRLRISRFDFAQDSRYVAHEDEESWQLATIPSLWLHSPRGAKGDGTAMESMNCGTPRGGAVHKFGLSRVVRLVVHAGAGKR